MAYISAEDTKLIRKALKEKFPKVKFAVRKDGHLALNVVIKSAPMEIEFSANEGYKDVNHYHLHRYPETEASFYKEVLNIMNTAGTRENFDESDSMTDYFHVGYYIHLSVGEWDKPFVNES
jgi:hypothetical protein